jgi:hypothetical protein
MVLITGKASNSGMDIPDRGRVDGGRYDCDDGDDVPSD